MFDEGMQHGPFAEGCDKCGHHIVMYEPTVSQLQAVSVSTITDGSLLKFGVRCIVIVSYIIRASASLHAWAVAASNYLLTHGEQIHQLEIINVL